ncbi:MAG: creatininase family protein [Proteobacteria bacterium]|nr:creatininase family protein [Pseudomonadota bacterium]
MAGNVYELAELTRTDLLALDKSRCVVLMAVSPLEVHGPHLPLKTDYCLSQAVVESTARQFMERLPGHDAVLAPVLPVGADVLPLPGSVGVRPRVLRDLITDVGLGFADAGFPVTALVSGHGGPRHNTAMELACRRVMAKRPGVKMFSLTSRLILHVLLGDFLEEFQERYEGPLSREQIAGLWPPDIHAGALETSLAQIFMPECIGPGCEDLPPVHLGAGSPLAGRMLRLAARLLSRLPSFDLSADERRLLPIFFEHLADSAGTWMFPAGDPPSYAGFPALAGPELGAAYLDMIREMGANLLTDVVSGKKSVDDAFTLFSRSWILRLASAF